MENKNTYKYWLAFVFGMLFMVVMAVIFERLSRGAKTHQESQTLMSPQQIETHKTSFTENLKIQNQESNRTYIGIDVQDIPDEEGVLIEKVMDESPAKKGGLKRGDVIVRFNGRNVENVEVLKNLVKKISPDEIAKFVVERDGKKKSIYVKTGENDANTNASLIQLAGFTGNNSHSWGLTVAQSENGVVVVSVSPGSIADKAGIKTGDLIKGINKKDVYNMASFFAAISEKKQVMMDVLRQSKNIYLFLKMPEGQATVPFEPNRPQSGGMIRPYTTPSKGDTNRPIYVPGYDNFSQSGKNEIRKKIL